MDTYYRKRVACEIQIAGLLTLPPHWIGEWDSGEGGSRGAGLGVFACELAGVTRKACSVH